MVWHGRRGKSAESLTVQAFRQGRVTPFAVFLPPALGKGAGSVY
jgi:hypothetical protein